MPTPFLVKQGGFQCPFCPKIYSLANSLRTHVAQKHDRPSILPMVVDNLDGSDHEVAPALQVNGTLEHIWIGDGKDLLDDAILKKYHLAINVAIPFLSCLKHGLSVTQRGMADHVLHHHQLRISPDDLVGYFNDSFLISSSSSFLSLSCKRSGKFN